MNSIRKISTAFKLLSRNGPGATWGALRRNFRQMYLTTRGGAAFVYRNVDGIRFVCDPSSSTSVYWYLAGKHYEAAELKVCAQWISPGDVCLDLGANIGQYAAALAPLVGPRGQIISVEPSPATVTILKRTCAMLGLKQVAIVPACVTDRRGERLFHAATGDTPDIGSSLGTQLDGQMVQTIEVPSFGIDDLVTDYGVMNCVSLVKLDIEGAEPLALNGAHGMFASENVPLCIVEVNTVALAGFGAAPADVLRHFLSEQFTLYHGPCNEGDETAEFRVGKLYRMRDPSTHKWPHCSNVIAIPRTGNYAARRAQLKSCLADFAA